MYITYACIHNTHTQIKLMIDLIHELKQIQLTLPSTLELPTTESHLPILNYFEPPS